MMEDGRKIIEEGRAVIGIELGSTRIKAVMVDKGGRILAKGAFAWENHLVDGVWTYGLEEAWDGLQKCYASLREDVRKRYGVELRRAASIGISGMMHGYLPFDGEGRQLAPFRTWRNNMTGEAAAALTELFQYNIPQRWSIAHLYHAMLRKEAHVPEVRFLTTLAGYVHWKLTGRKCLGIGEASGMFPMDIAAGNYHQGMLDKFDELVREQGFDWKIRDILPEVLLAGSPAGTLTEEGAKLLDVSGSLEAGIPMCPPEGDAGTGMVATNSVRVRTGNISAGTSAFAMLVLERELSRLHENLDMVTTPSGKLVAMAHSNNCSTAINAWAGIFAECLRSFGVEKDMDEVYGTLFRKAEEGAADCGGLMAYCFYSGEHGVGLTKGCPMVLHPPEAEFTLANLMRTQIYTAFAAMKLGIDTLVKEEKVSIDRVVGHGGIFKTPGVAQKILAAAIHAPVAILETAGEGGAWGIALLAAYLSKASELSLEDYLDKEIFGEYQAREIEPDPSEEAGYEEFICRYRKYLEAESLAANS